MNIRLRQRARMMPEGNARRCFPEGKQRGVADANDAGSRDCCRMHKSYAVVFCERGGDAAAGALELRQDRLLLMGRAGQNGAPAARSWLSWCR